MKTVAALAGLLFLLGACVAPEEAPPPRMSAGAPTAVRPSTSPALEAAPTPNRAIRRSADDEIIRLAH